ncbi:hypothetical protein FKM82_018481 [Ascaphus truei]
MICQCMREITLGLLRVPKTPSFRAPISQSYIQYSHESPQDPPCITICFVVYFIQLFKALSSPHGHLVMVPASLHRVRSSKRRHDVEKCRGSVEY